jgi:hypothetical protein
MPRIYRLALSPAWTSAQTFLRALAAFPQRMRIQEICSSIHCNLREQGPGTSQRWHPAFLSN